MGIGLVGVVDQLCNGGQVGYQVLMWFGFGQGDVVQVGEVWYVFKVDGQWIGQIFVVIGLFDQYDVVGYGLIQFQFGYFIGVGQVIQVGVLDFGFGGIGIGLDQCEGWVGYVFGQIVLLGVDEGVGEMCFVCVDWVFQCDYIVGFQNSCYYLCKVGGQIGIGGIKGGKQGYGLNLGVWRLKVKYIGYIVFVWFFVLFLDCGLQCVVCKDCLVGCQMLQYYVFICFGKDYVMFFYDIVVVDG